ncbi:hypothetical protein Cob_v012587 [Colletotrichum orbiculare MAFF 240422]|uniref:Uncharacterized protein n=1 Tax=Colletotrichum orbiculare (strain 104-T / ATCC 96160 / CBS 514.97 / LARS 414 / MAFF 240422) TaxID=1213857 RepID=A0A484F8Q7_COLOR|nr:hypothetical protein Cob_v012587 [Colletotrichum orbiculare MAFF 240422]
MRALFSPPRTHFGGPNRLIPSWPTACYPVRRHVPILWVPLPDSMEHAMFCAPSVAMNPRHRALKALHPAAVTEV